MIVNRYSNRKDLTMKAATILLGPSVVAWFSSAWICGLSPILELTHLSAPLQFLHLLLPLPN